MATVMLTTDERKTQEYAAKVDSEMAEVAQGFEFLEENFRSDMSLVQDAQGLLEQGKAYRKQILELAEQNKNEEAIQIYFNLYELLWSR